MTITTSQILSSVYGFAVADALGVPVEFKPRSVRVKDPVAEMREYGTFRQPKGTWSDDTSMTIAGFDALKKGLDYQLVMEAYQAWADNAEYTATDKVFDIGNATGMALNRFGMGYSPLKCGGTDVRSNGNGSLMRILPAVFYCAKHMSDASLADRLDIIHKFSCLTHAHDISLIGCGIYACIAWRMLEKPDLDSVYAGLREAEAFYADWAHFSRYARIFRPDFAQLPYSAIESSGYVVTTLDAALWCLLNSETYADCVLKAVNLGEDTDTVAAIAGGLAGLLYGQEGIPADWLDALLKKDLIARCCQM